MMKNAMILAAGRGERLKPISNTTPKALCEIKQIPIIDYHIHNLCNAGYDKVVINHAHLGWKLRNHLICLGKKLPIRIVFSPEPPGGLETGGGIFNALKYFSSQTFTVINADIFTDYDLKKLSIPNESLAHLVLVENTCKTKGDFGLHHENIVNNNKELIFSGISCYNKDIFSAASHGRYSITPILRNFANQNKITGEIHNGKWIDIGSIEKLHQANNLV